MLSPSFTSSMTTVAAMVNTVCCESRAVYACARWEEGRGEATHLIDDFDLDDLTHLFNQACEHGCETVLWRLLR
jgi:hypothetical protein